MKKIIICATFFIPALMISCQLNNKQATTEVIRVTDSVALITDSLRFSEATCWNGESMYISNFGSKELNPLNKEGKGYILEFKNGQTKVLIPADGKLNAPKGMCVTNNHLFIADVGAIIVYNLADITKSQKITFPKDESYVNDIAVSGNTIYVSVTNTGNIYKLDVTSPDKISSRPVLFAKVPGANGLAIADSVMYVASYPVDGNTAAANVIYTIKNFKAPIVSKLFNRMGQYDGLALSDDHKTLYFTTWVNGGVGSVTLSDTAVQMIPMPIKLSGPADLTYHNGKLYIPDLPNSRVLIHKTK